MIEHHICVYVVEIVEYVCMRGDRTLHMCVCCGNSGLCMYEGLTYYCICVYVGEIVDYICIRGGRTSHMCVCWGNSGLYMYEG